MSEKVEAEAREKSALLKAAWRRAKTYLPEPNFITLHYLYFILTGLITGLILWGSSTPARSVKFIDALFLTFSAMTEAGLNTVNLSTLNTWQQVLLFVLIMTGSSIFVSASVVHIRRKAFETRFRNEIEREAKLRGRSRAWLPLQRLREFPTLAKTDQTSPNRANPEQEQRRPSQAEASRVTLDQLDENAIDDDDEAKLEKGTEAEQSKAPEQVNGERSNQDEARPTTLRQTSDQSIPHTHGDHISFSPDVRFRGRDRGSSGQNDLSRQHFISRALTMQGVGAQPGNSARRLTLSSSRIPSLSTDTPHGFPRMVSEDRRSEYLPASAVITRNSNFAQLTEQDRLRLGGTEYRAVVFLSWIVPMYFILWQLLGCLALGAYVHNYYARVCRENGLDPWWVGAFNAVSAFNNSGMSLLDANMIAFNEAVYILLTMSLLILAGNTCYPVFLRLIVWTILKLLPNGEDWSDARITLQFLLDHPRRCYTNLFPARHTWWLFLSVIMLNGIDCAFYALLNIGNDAITHFSPGIEFLDGLFQAFAVRSGGFYIVAISSVRVSLQVLYVIMMYISAFPVAITMRNSNVYEERSLGIYSDEPGYDEEKWASLTYLKRVVGLENHNPATRGYFVQQQLRAQLAHDIWWLVLAIFLIMIIEGSQFEREPAVFSVFNVIFEVVSAYGTVGISVGLPDQAYSFCGAWHSLSKLILVAVMIRGRHRGLPVAIDKAVLLPRDYLNDLEEEDAAIRMDPSTARSHVD